MTYTYNSYQELCSVIEPEIGPPDDLYSAGATLMGYDAAGNLTWSASGLPSTTACSSTGNTTAINARKAVRTYDARNRIVTLTFPDLNGNQSWTYTADGLPDTVTTYNDGGTSSVLNTYAYNKRRLLIGESQQADSNSWSVGYGYDPNASLSTVVYPDSLTVSYAPNALGQPTQAGSYATNVTYYPNGAIQQFTYGNGIVHSLTQNLRGLPDISQDVDGATAIHHDEYDYDPVGNVVGISDGVGPEFRGDRTMAYDDLNRLVQVVSPTAPQVLTPVFGTATYSYDALDNLTHVHVTAGPKIRDQDYVYDAHNRLTNLMEGGASVVGLGYDVQGNLNNKSGVAYTFDYGNRMRAGGPETYRYDVQGRRIRSSSTAGVVYSLYAQSGQLLFQRDERSSKRRQYVYLGGSLVAESDVPLAGGSATVTYQHTDALGSPVATTNSAKAVLQRSEYEPYGYLLNRPMQDGPGYTGHVTDAATGLVYMQQRYYDPLCGCFVSTDPVTANRNTGGNFNRYWYANDNPYRFTDPDGRCIEDACLGEAAVIGGAIGGLVSGVVYAATTDHFTWGGLATNVGTGAAVGAATAVAPVLAAAKFVTTAAKLAVAGSTAAGIGATGSVARQAITTGKVDAKQAAVEGVANAVGLAAGSAAAPIARGLATETSPAIGGAPVTSLSGRVFMVGAQPATQTVSKPAQEAVQESVGAAASVSAEKILEKPNVL